MYDRLLSDSEERQIATQGLGMVLYMSRFKVHMPQIVGLYDAGVPLLAHAGKPSALTFAPQKGADADDMAMLEMRLRKAIKMMPEGDPRHTGSRRRRRPRICHTRHGRQAHARSGYSGRGPHQRASPPTLSSPARAVSTGSRPWEKYYPISLNTTAPPPHR